jgi:multicomponent Na+:H+ antiporter subunit B
MRNLTALIFATGLSFLLLVLTGQFLLGQAPMLAGGEILDEAATQLGAANIVTSVVLGYRAIDTLGEIAILFTAASATSLVLSSLGGRQNTRKDNYHGGLVLQHSVALFFPLLLVLGLYIVLHGHLTPGGGFQGGVVLAAAFFLPLLAVPGRGVRHHGIALIEGFSGAAFIVIGIIALLQGEAFLQPLFETGQMGSLLSGSSLPLLYIALGLKVGAELAGLLANLADIHDPEEDSAA